MLYFHSRSNQRQRAGTLSANPVGMRAGFATLSKMEAIDGWRQLNERTSRFCEDLRAGFACAGADLDVIQYASIFWIRPRTEAPVRRVDAIPAPQGAWFRRLFHAALERGVYLPPSGFEVCFLSVAHDADTLRSAAGALVDAAKEAGRPW